MTNYIFNLETTKIELHFDKSDYVALSDAQKAELKSAFLWSKWSKCWVSRAKEPNLWGAKRVAEKLGFTEEQREGERLSFAEQQERKAERAESRAERYEEYATNAERRAEVLQKPINNMHGDIAFFTQPIIAGHAGSRAFANRRERMFAQYEKGSLEYKKSEYYRGRAETATTTANQTKFKDVAFLDRRIKEVKKEIRQREKNIIAYEEKLFKLENGGTITRYSGEAITTEEVTGLIERELELLNVAMDKETFYLDKIDECGGIAFSPANIKIGYIVKIQHYGLCEIVGMGRVNVTFKISTGGASGMVLEAAYAEILEIIKATELKEQHPFREGEVYECRVWDGKNYVKKQFTIIKATDSTIKLQTGDEKPILRKPSRSKFRENTWTVSISDNYDGTIYKAVNDAKEA